MKAPLGSPLADRIVIASTLLNLFFLIFAVPCSLWDLGSLTRD